MFSGRSVFCGERTPGLHTLARMDTVARTGVQEFLNFKPGEDIFHLENAVLKNIGWVSRPLRDDAFHLGKAAEDAFNRIIYDKTTGSLYYDSDGTGAASQIKIAVLTNKAALDYASFYVI